MSNERERNNLRNFVYVSDIKHGKSLSQRLVWQLKFIEKNLAAVAIGLENEGD